MLLRMVRHGRLLDAVRLFPLFFMGELARIRGFHDARGSKDPFGGVVSAPAGQR